MRQATPSLTDKVIAGGYCVGCGLCRHASPDEFDTTIDEIGRVQAVRIGFMPDSTVDRICPFADAGDHENELAENLFSGASNFSNDFGAYEALYAGHVSEGTFRDNGSSGGMGTWIATELLRLNLVDVVLSVGPTDGTYAFQFGTSVSPDQLRSRGKSRYYPVTIGDELGEAFRYERMAVIGLPCFIKGIRRLAETDPAIKARLTYAVSLVCGHLKTRAFGQSLAWQLGVHPDNLTGIDYRWKIPARAAARYGITVSSRAGNDIQSPMDRLVGHNWGHGLFKVDACDYCDDVFGETADISIGDAWLPKYENDSKGTNIVVVRNAVLQKIIDDGGLDGRLVLDQVAAEEVSASQAGGLRHRREGLSYRLALKQKAGLWVPKKRVSPSFGRLSETAKKVQDARLHAKDLSHKLFREALRQDDLGIFINGIRPATSVIDSLQRAPFMQRLASLPRRLFRKLQRTLGK